MKTVFKYILNVIKSYLNDVVCYENVKTLLIIMTLTLIFSNWNFKIMLAFSFVYVLLTIVAWLIVKLIDTYKNPK